MMGVRGRPIALVVLGLGFVLAGVGAHLRWLVSPILLAGPMLQAVGPNTFTVVWRTSLDEPGQIVVLHGDETRTVPAAVSDGQYVARVEGLEPNTVYDYVVRRVSTSGKASKLAQGTAQTAKSADLPFRFLVFGDSGEGSRSQKTLGRQMLLQKPDLILHTGDLVYPAGESEDFRDEFFAPYAELLRSTPFYPSLGNHDVRTEDGAALLRAFVLPENGPDSLPPERNYYFDYGNARFIALDSTRDSQQLRQVIAPWLARVLDEADTTWKFAFFHHPPYTNSRHRADEKLQRTIVPILEKGGVDVVFCGHNHIYERTEPIREGRIAADGIVYVVTGAGGAREYAERDEPIGYIDSYDDEALSFTVVDIDGSTFHLRQIDIHGQVVDDWSAVSRGAGARERQRSAAAR